jgi:Multidrug resistance efflux pump
MSMDDALVEADKVGVSTDVSGIVREVDVTENQKVKAGQLLYRLDDLRSGSRWSAPRLSSAWSATTSTR